MGEPFRIEGFDKANLLRFCVSKEVRDMWAVFLTKLVKLKDALHGVR